MKASFSLEAKLKALKKLTKEKKAIEEQITEIRKEIESYLNTCEGQIEIEMKGD